MKKKERREHSGRGNTSMKVREGKGVWLVEASMAEAAVPKTVSLVCTVSELTSRLHQGSGAR